MLVPDLNTLTPLTSTSSTSKSAVQAAADSSDKESALRAVADDFEAAFVAQMLTHSGLADAMTSGEGKMAEAFGSFYIEQLAEKITDNDGFGLADSIYKQLERYDADGKT